ncbi:hypothetical protein GQ43DRAFT_452672 [Delitschia confertaspora ATCC 74209]|uniref:MFS general substrate transporter n=1 Tax=Delitschia confertaspora ATCC 74209 TaxID=1513339 RepID=A0A9P4JX30_9PLEO|nr:hypothetical protein GQ43DRAFT_452672 [Delitschia confertaspora ATCC 74209]
MFNLDAVLLTFAGLGYFIKYLDHQTSIVPSKEDHSLYKNQLNYMQTCWNVGYIVGEVPSNIILTWFRHSEWIHTMEVNLAESTFYPGMLHIIGSWYRKDELTKRIPIFHVAGTIAIMCSGYLMAGVYHLGGKGGFKGWQWLFLIDGIVSLPIVIAGYFFNHDVPEIAKPVYLTEEQEGRETRKSYTKPKIRKIFTSWHIYALSALYALYIKEGKASQPSLDTNAKQPPNPRKLTNPPFKIYNNVASASASVFAQYLKSSTHSYYTINAINAYSTTTYAVLSASALFYAWTSDTFLAGRRWPLILFSGLANLCLLRQPGHLVHFHMIADSEEQGIVIGSMNAAAYVVQAWLPLLVWQQHVDAPSYWKGYVTSLVGVVW